VQFLQLIDYTINMVIIKYLKGKRLKGHEVPRRSYPFSAVDWPLRAPRLPGGYSAKTIVRRLDGEWLSRRTVRFGVGGPFLLARNRSAIVIVFELVLVLDFCHRLASGETRANLIP
jgi:hypothetical protein